MINFSNKQKDVIRDFLNKGFFTLLCGSVRSGKTYSALMAYLIYTQSIERDKRHIIAGRNLRIMENELLVQLQGICDMLGSSFTYNKTEGLIKINSVTYIVIAGYDENSAKRIQSLTASCAFVDEVQLVPESFFNQVLARLSYDGSKLICTCNPEGRRHWLKLKFMDEKKVDQVVDFTLDDNPSLGESAKDRYKAMFSGVFYERNILGKWVSAEGVIYADYETFKGNIEKIGIKYTDIGVDYGIKSVTAYEKLSYLKDGRCVVTDTFRYDGEVAIKTDKDLVDDLIFFMGKDKIKAVFVDPSAVSFIAEARSRKLKSVIRPASNAVVPGVKTVLNGLGSRKLLIKETPSNDHLFDEMSSYCWKEGAIDTPRKQDDHHCDALRYAYHTRNRNLSIAPFKVPRGL